MSEAVPASASGKTSETFYTALVTNAAVLALELLAFVFLKHRLGRIYQPRAYLPPPQKRAVDLPRGAWRWLLAIFAVPTADVLEKNGLDAYMFLRFLRLLVILFASITLLTWLVILPVDTAGITDPVFTDSLQRLSWGNIPADAAARYAAHIVVVYITTFWTLFLMRTELIHFAAVRQAFLMSRAHSRLAQARTVLITNVPAELCDEKELTRWASFVPGGVQNVWIYRDTTDLNQDYKDRLKLCKKLEKAAAKLVRSVIKAHSKHDAAEAKARRRAEHARGAQARPDEGTGGRDDAPLDDAGRDTGREVQQNGVRPSADGTLVASEELKTQEKIPNEETASALRKQPAEDDLLLASARPYRSRTITSEMEAGRRPPSSPGASFQEPASTGGAPSVPSSKEQPTGEELLELYAQPQHRPHHRLGFMGLWGKKVDTIIWCKDEIVRLNTSIDEKRAELAGEGKRPRPMGSVFIQCNLQMGAHVLAQCVSYHQKWIDVSPKDVIWDNIDDGAYETRFRYVTSWIGSLVLIAIWFAPVSFVGTLSNVTTLCDNVSWLCWIRDAPAPVPGIIQGVLPPLFLAILFAVLPWLLKGLAWYENIPRWSLLSISVYKRYFMFLVVHGFLVVTLTSALTSTAHKIAENPTKTVSDLAAQLPNASIFFLTWTLTQGLSGAGSALLQLGHLLVHFVRKWFLGRTPRQAYAVTFIMPKANFGLVLPKLSLLATIGLAYSVLAPVINGLATVSFILFFYSWKFLLTWVFDQPDESETGGKYFPVAINTLFAGLYIEQFCLAVLFFLKIADNAAFAVGGVLMLVLMGLTVLAQLLLQRSFTPITEFLPMSLATKQMQERWEQQRLIHQQQSRVGAEDDLDLFSRDGIKSLVRRRIQAPAERIASQVHSNIAKTARVDRATSLDKSDVDDLLEEDQERPRGSTSAYSVDHGGSGLHRTPSHRSRCSEKFQSRDSGDTPAELPEEPPLAVAPSAASEEEDVDKDFDVHGFDHPSTYAEQPWVWVPKDGLGISEVLVRELRESGVEASDEGASIDAGGTVEVQRAPPDEDWAGGHDA